MKRNNRPTHRHVLSFLERVAPLSPDLEELLGELSAEDDEDDILLAEVCPQCGGSTFEVLRAPERCCRGQIETLFVQCSHCQQLYEIHSPTCRIIEAQGHTSRRCRLVHCCAHVDSLNILTH